MTSAGISFDLPGLPQVSLSQNPPSSLSQAFISFRKEAHKILYLKPVSTLKKRATKSSKSFSFQIVHDVGIQAAVETVASLEGHIFSATTQVAGCFPIPQRRPEPPRLVAVSQSVLTLESFFRTILLGKT